METGNTRQLNLNPILEQTEMEIGNTSSQLVDVNVQNGTIGERLVQSRKKVNLRKPRLGLRSKWMEEAEVRAMAKSEWQDPVDEELDEILWLLKSAAGDGWKSWVRGVGVKTATSRPLGSDDDLRTLGPDNDLKILGSDDDLETLGFGDNLRILGFDDDLSILGSDDDHRTLGFGDDLRILGSNNDLGPWSLATTSGPESGPSNLGTISGPSGLAKTSGFSGILCGTLLVRQELNEVLVLNVLGLNVLGLNVLGLKVLGLNVLGLKVLDLNMLGLNMLNQGWQLEYRCNVGGSSAHPSREADELVLTSARPSREAHQLILAGKLMSSSSDCSA
ncbi:S-layer-RTX protein [Striga asiatica]|uniref:S-layer-RTX protein n=1 Tax=Striga asiatica TaxID=4170 RepID=A0A5A7QCK0_STRAF|nr:S-layer-RTX protein [Striga asiatica]